MKKQFLAKDTLIPTSLGLIKIQELSKDDKVFLNGKYLIVNNLFYKPQKKLIQVLFKGRVFEKISSVDYQYKIINKDDSISCKTASELKIGDRVLTYPSHLDLPTTIKIEDILKSSYLLQTSENYNSELFLNLSNKMSNQSLRDFMRGLYFYNIVEHEHSDDSLNSKFKFKNIDLTKRIAQVLFERLGIKSYFDENDNLVITDEIAKDFLEIEVESISVIDETIETYSFDTPPHLTKWQERSELE